jgi:hypothetical protein
MVFERRLVLKFLQGRVGFVTVIVIEALEILKKAILGATVKTVSYHLPWSPLFSTFLT